MPGTKPEELTDRTRTTKAGLAAAVVLVLIFLAQCVSAAKSDSVSWDESQHLYSGWLSWKHADFGFNPEVPPLVKMWCAIPLLHRHMTQPAYIGGSFKKEGFVLGQRFLLANGIDQTLIPARMMAVLLSAMLAATIFLAALEMYGQTAALLALALFCFDPNFLAHGAFVTTDIGASFTLLLSIYLFYRVLKKPSAIRVVLLGLAVGMTLTAKFTGIFVIPMIVVIWLLDLWNRRHQKNADHESLSGRQLTVVVAAISAIGMFFVWATYHFRFAARPDNLTLDPLTSQYMQELSSPLSRSALLWAANHHLLPEAYLYGLADTKISAASLPSYLFGNLTHGASRWYYPAAITIKCTLPFLILLVVTIVALASKRWKISREAIVLIVPPAVLFVIASTSDIGIGFRHLMPIFPMLYILIAGCAAYLVNKNRKLVYVLGALLLWQIGTSELSRPGLVAYANEAWGGPSKTHLYLTDSNTDWGQQLKYVKKYLDEHPGKPCYFAYFEQGPVDFRDYGVQCQVLPTGSGSWTGMPSLRFGANPNVSGLVLVSDGVLAGADIPGKVNPYARFRTLRPNAVIDRAVYVYDGQFNLGPAAAIEHVEASGELLAQGQAQDALSEAELAKRLDPDSATALEAEGNALAALGRNAEAQAAYRSALQAPELDPVFQKDLVMTLRKKSGQ
jgi:Dolichyl-phosphate-mannose-protein mannosyltransferase